MSLNMLNILLWPLFVGLGLAVAAIIGIGVGTYRAATHKRRQNKKLLKFSKICKIKMHIFVFLVYTK